MLKEVSLAFLLVASPIVGSKPVEAIEGSYKIESLDTTEIACKTGEDCLLEATLVATNRTGVPLYRTGIYTGIHSPMAAKMFNLEFVGFDGRWTWGQSFTDEVVPPGGQIVTRARLDNPLTSSEGRFVYRIYVDGRVCNNEVSPPDCYYTGAGSVELVINKIR